MGRWFVPLVVLVSLVSLSVPVIGQEDGFDRRLAGSVADPMQPGAWFTAEATVIPQWDEIRDSDCEGGSFGFDGFYRARRSESACARASFTFVAPYPTAPEQMPGLPSWKRGDLRFTTMADSLIEATDRTHPRFSFKMTIHGCLDSTEADWSISSQGGPLGRASSSCSVPLGPSPLRVSVEISHEPSDHPSTMAAGAQPEDLAEVAFGPMSFSSGRLSSTAENVPADEATRLGHKGWKTYHALRIAEPPWYSDLVGGPTPLNIEQATFGVMVPDDWEPTDKSILAQKGFEAIPFYADGFHVYAFDAEPREQWPTDATLDLYWGNTTSRVESSLFVVPSVIHGLLWAILVVVPIAATGTAGWTWRGRRYLFDRTEALWLGAGVALLAAALAAMTASDALASTRAWPWGWETMTALALLAASGALLLWRTLVLRRMDTNLRFTSLEKETHDMEAALTGVTHDLKTPLLALDWLTRDLQDEIGRSDPEAVIETLGRIRRNIGGMDRLVQDLVFMSRAETEAKQAPVVEIAPVVEDAVEATRPLARGRETHISVALEREARTAMPSSHLNRIIVNLVGNAIKYGKTPGGHVDVRVRPGEHHGARVWLLEVEDDGPGVPDATKERIFGLFERNLDHPRAEEGTGIGLAMVRRLARAAGGDVHVEDGITGGACFVVRCPTAMGPPQKD